jgi:hypothetical protein
MEEPRTECALCSGSTRCLACSGLGVRVFPGPVRIACSYCSGTGVCFACADAPRVESVTEREELPVTATSN